MTKELSQFIAFAAAAGISPYSDIGVDSNYRIPKRLKNCHTQGKVKCCKCGTANGTLYKHGEAYICKKCRQESEADHG